MKLQLSDVLVISQQMNAEAIQTFRWIQHGISDVSVLSSCINLVELDLSQNAITEILFIQFLPNLRRLQLDFNGIHSLQIFNKTTINGDSIYKLQYLSLKQNKITNLQQIQALGKIKSLISVNVLCNEILNDPQFYQYALAMLPNVLHLNETQVRYENGDLIDLDKFIDSLPGTVEDVTVEPWLPESAFDLIELPGFNEICIELEQAVRSSIEKFYVQETQ
ncbi:Leucine-rich repeat protein [Spironucleus salmonicida]|uniref:Leucine-rich repeat protein n=1 Tax=Spironucleus salmonicida TaxID=348837 RepID=V6LM03_9EUKA|nr:Leucine-rich repeat protein [Spironucleus salmonicida]|eukprot:EST45248.1 hypothetical protein SS50377_14824 [Spironucleus salmonicida]